MTGNAAATAVMAKTDADILFESAQSKLSADQMAQWLAYAYGTMENRMTEVDFSLMRKELEKIAK